MDVIAIDIGGMSVKTAVVRLEPKNSKYGFEILYRESLVTKASAHNLYFCRFIAEAIEKILTQTNFSQIKQIGIGSPGPIDLREGMVLESANLPNLKRAPLVKTLQEYLRQRFKRDFKIFFQNDANCAALGTLYFDHQVGSQNFAVITLGTGVGGGLILNNKLFSGYNGNGFEVGHVPMNLSSIMSELPSFTCGCGNTGCLESIASTRGILNYFHYFSENQFQHIVNVQQLNQAIIEDPQQTLAVNGLKALNLAAQALGKTCVTVTHLLNLEEIIFTGGIAGMANQLLPVIEDICTKEIFEVLKQRLKIRFTKGDESAGLLGAAALSLS